MKKSIVIVSIILLMGLMVAGNSMAWLKSSSNENPSSYTMGKVDIKVTRSHDDEIQVKNDGTSESYIRVKLIPQWSKPNLSISNVVIDINSSNWTDKQKDGYYYYKDSLKEHETSAVLVKDVEFVGVTEEYEGATFKLKAVAEGVQTSGDAWKKTWKLEKLPFTVY